MRRRRAWVRPQLPRHAQAGLQGCLKAPPGLACRWPAWVCEPPLHGRNERLGALVTLSPLLAMPRRDTTRRLGVAWLLASACLLHHLTHWLGGSAPRWLHALSSTPVHAALAALALLGERPCLLPLRVGLARARAVPCPLLRAAMRRASVCRRPGAGNHQRGLPRPCQGRPRHEQPGGAGRHRLLCRLRRGGAAAQAG